MSEYQSAEEYFIARDGFVRYVAMHVNPSRIAYGLVPIDLDAARECFRLLDEKPWTIKQDPSVGGFMPPDSAGEKHG